MNNYGEIYLCFYKHDTDFLVGNKNINVAKKIKNYCKTNSSTIQDFFKTKNLQEYQKLIDLFNYQIFKNKQVIIDNYKTFYQNFYDIFFYQTKFSSQQNIEFFLRRQNLNANWQDFVVLPKENIRKKIKTLIFMIKLELKKQGINHCWTEIVRISNTQKIITTTGYNKAEKEIKIRKCSEPEQKLKELHQALQIKNRPFTKIKSVVHKPKPKIKQLTINAILSSA